MEELNKRAVLVKGIELSDNKITLLEQTGEQKYPTKYSFFKTTQKGEPSKAYIQFKEMEVEAGKVYNLAIKETKGTNSMSGKEVTYRNVMYFMDSNASMPTKAPQTSTSGLTDDVVSKIRIAFRDMLDRVEKLEDKVGGLVAILDEDKMKAYEFHRDTNRTFQEQQDKQTGEDEIPIIQ